ncbi:MAG: glyoxalase [Chloroflexi bacterium]|nr:MAG: glyoxalase [Chloroflexota bacterium]
MRIVKKYPNSLFCWVNLGTSDFEGAKVFYGGLFGWLFEDKPADMGASYTIACIDGHSVAGLGSLPPDAEEQGIPTSWSSFVKHDDIEAVAAKITAGGGNIVMPVTDVMTEGRMLLATDPTGALFGVWEPQDNIGAQVVNAPNSLLWNELQTHDVEAAQAFYASVFGWAHETGEDGYVVVSVDGRMQAGMMALQEEWGDVPPHWSVYFLVEDVETAVAKVHELGGTVLRPPFPVAEMGKMAVVQDPQGGVFNVMESFFVDTPPGY